MKNDLTTSEPKDPLLWNLARKRVAFKSHALTYVLVNTLLWIIWIAGNSPSEGSGLPWPIFPTAGWGIGLFSHYVSAFVPLKNNPVEKEYQRLIEKNKL